MINKDNSEKLTIDAENIDIDDILDKQTFTYNGRLITRSSLVKPPEPQKEDDKKEKDK